MDHMWPRPCPRPCRIALAKGLWRCGQAEGAVSVEPLRPLTHSQMENLQLLRPHQRRELSVAQNLPQ